MNKIQNIHNINELKKFIADEIEKFNIEKKLDFSFPILTPDFISEFDNDIIPKVKVQELDGIQETLKKVYEFYRITKKISYEDKISYLKKRFENLELPPQITVQFHMIMFMELRKHHPSIFDFIDENASYDEINKLLIPFFDDLYSRGEINLIDAMFLNLILFDVMIEDEAEFKELKDFRTP